MHEIMKRCKPSFAPSVVLLLATIVSVMALAMPVDAHERHQVWAPPAVFGPWKKVANHASRVAYRITVEPIGSTQVEAEIRYYGADNKLVTQKFAKEIQFTTGNSIAPIEIRLRGVLLGSSCFVDVYPSGVPAKR